MLTVEQLNEIFGFANDGVSEIDPAEFKEHYTWSSIATGRSYNPSSSKSSRLSDPALRYLHRFMSYTICGRGSSNGVVTRTELFFIWCMLNNKKVNTGVFLSLHLDQIASSKKGRICAGGFITAIAEAIHGFDPATTLMRRVRGSSIIGLKSLKFMRLIGSHGEGSSASQDDATPSQKRTRTQDVDGEFADNSSASLPTNLEIVARIDVLEAKMDKQHAELMDSIKELRTSCEATLRLYSHTLARGSSPPQ